MNRSALPALALLLVHLSAPSFAETSGPDEDGDLGEAVVTHVLLCEGALAGDQPIDGRKVAELRAEAAGINLSIGAHCACSGDYYQDHHQDIWQDLEARAGDPGVYDEHMLASLDACLLSATLRPVGQATPAGRPAALCLQVANGEIRSPGFDYELQASWEQGSGLTAADLCDCAGLVVDETLPEEDINAADDPEAFYLEAVIAASLDCRRAMWQP